ncbi:MAG TPA: NAD-dependent epimerase/dehydratase family protein [Patescibacteria group bacterium]|nr:NAD-dependent epimerase/dehydratase family protein [Patescibacteria group bacterium]
MSSFDKKNILVTGGAGFIGSHLCEKLIKDSRIICLDDFSTGGVMNIDLLLKHPDFELVRQSVCDPIDLESLPELKSFKINIQGIQEIYHLACPTSPKRFEEFKMRTLDVNSTGMKNILDLAAKYKAKLVYASSSVVYGPRLRDKQVFGEEDYGVVNHMTPRGCYDEGKRFAETMVNTYQEVYGLDVKIARIFRTYGPREKLFDGEMIPDFIINALDNKDLVVYGDEHFTTSLCYVDDVVSGLIKLMSAFSNIGPINLGSSEDLKIVEVAKRIIEMTESSSQIVFDNPLIFMTPLCLPDISKAKDLLGWVPLVRLEDGLRKTIDYMQAYKSLLQSGLR